MKPQPSPEEFAVRVFQERGYETGCAIIRSHQIEWSSDKLNELWLKAIELQDSNSLAAVGESTRETS